MCLSQPTWGTLCHTTDFYCSSCCTNTIVLLRTVLLSLSYSSCCIVVTIQLILLFLILLAVRMEPFVKLCVIDQFTASLRLYEQSIYHTLSCSFPHTLPAIHRSILLLPSFSLALFLQSNDVPFLSLSLSLCNRTIDSSLCTIKQSTTLSLSLPCSSFFYDQFSSVHR